MANYMKELMRMRMQRKEKILGITKMLYLVKNTADKTVYYYKTKVGSAGKTAIVPAKVKMADGITYKVTGICAGALKGRKKITGVTVEKNVKEIGKTAFKNDTALKKITLKTKKLAKVGAAALKGIYKNCKIYCPEKKLKKYRKLFKNKGQKKTVKLIGYAEAIR